jgi:D-tyrosyl-tRNA(Tyr) deacylase
MIAVIQRAKDASVRIDGSIKSAISYGMVILLGIEEADSEDDINWLTRKIVNLRIFDDDNGVMNLSSLEVKGEILTISQFTLHASTKKGNRPSYIKAAKPDIAIPLYESFLKKLDLMNEGKVSSGEFGAEMQVQLTNDGPVTIIIDSKERK